MRSPLAGTSSRWRVSHAVKVLYIDGELPSALFQARLKELGEPTPNLLTMSRDYLFSRNTFLPDLATPEGQDFYDQFIEKHDADVICLDSLSTLVRSGVENDAEVLGAGSGLVAEASLQGTCDHFLAP